ncbi:DUF3592 domain-containing protein [Streptomyces sp. NPDC050263]|uniref:DUF3592 domain-containing protein n=1 Tax=Streptomyces sp. NPDC050263 TaxID=3155037 RepID=UPI003421DDED
MDWTPARFLVAMPFFGMAVLLYLRHRALVRRGVTVKAECVDRRWSGQGDKPTYVLRYTAEGGGEKFHIDADEREVPAGTREGDLVDVCYDPQKPQRAMAARSVNASFWKRGYEVASLSAGLAFVVWAALSM